MTAVQPQETAEDAAKAHEAALAKEQEKFKNLEAELAREREARQRLETEARAAPPAEPARPQKTREELQSLVEQGVLTEAAMLDILNEQRVEKIRDELRTEVTQKQAEERVSTQLQAQLEAYKENIPAITQPGSPERAKLAKEYDYLRGLGQPDSVATEVMALRAAFGEPERVEERTRERAETHVETGGAADVTGEGPKGSGPDVSPRLKAHYTKLIDSGIYKGWDDPDLVKELKVRGS